MVTYTTEFVKEQMIAIGEMLSAGIRIGPPEAPNASGCTLCLFHGYDKDGNNLDGGSATVLLSYHQEGTYTLAEIRPVT